MKRKINSLDSILENERSLNVYSFGSGDMSQLGHGLEPKMIIRKYPTEIKNLDNIITINSGSLHNACIDNKGKVWTWGCNDDYALGRDEEESLPYPVFIPNQVIKVCCGASHTLALTIDHNIYSWGTYRDSRGIMGHDPNEEKTQYPKLLTELKNVIDIACSDSISVAVTSEGNVFQWGDISYIQRENEEQSLLSPNKVLFETSIKNVFAGGYSLFAIDNNNKVWGWGLNNYGQIGIKSENTWIQTPKLISSLETKNIISIASAIHHTICLDSDGIVYTFGRGDSGRLGHGNENNYETPTEIKSLNKVTSVSCGECHTCCVTASGKLYVFGSNNVWQLGIGKDDSDILTPIQLSISRTVLNVCCSSQHTIILTE